MTVNDNLSSTLDELSRAKQGIRRPKVVTLKAGEALFRFASTKNMNTGASIPSHQWARGAWWIPEPCYRRVIDNYTQDGLALGTVARGAAAVQPSWSKMDVSIKAYLIHDMNVYIGKGSTQFRDALPNGMFFTSRGWSDIDQIYIPNMRGASFKNLKVVRKKIITTDNFGF